MEVPVVIGLLEIMHGETEYDSSSSEYYSEFIYYFTDQVLQVKQEMKRQALFIVFKLLLS